MAKTDAGEFTAEIPSLVEAGDLTGIANRLLAAVRVANHVFGTDGPHLRPMMAMSPEDRLALSRLLFEHFGDLSDWQLEKLGKLTDALLHGHPVLIRAEKARASLAEAATYFEFTPFDAPHKWAAELVEAGVPFTVPMIALLRRHEQVPYVKRGLKHLFIDAPDPILNPGEEWADTAMAALPTLDPAWEQLLRLALKANSGKPSAAWEKKAAKLLAEIGPAEAAAVLRDWFDRVGRPRAVKLKSYRWDIPADRFYDTHNARALRGLLWAAAQLPDMARTVGRMVEPALTKVAFGQTRSLIVANAASWALSRMEDENAVSQLGTLTARVSHGTVFDRLDDALETKAEEKGLTRAEVRELAIDDHGLTGIGTRTETFGEVTAELTVTVKSVTLRWRNANGKLVKATPASVRADHAEPLRRLRADAKDLRKAVSTQSARLDKLLADDRRWSHATWKQRYLDHRLMGVFTRALIWVADEVPCAVVDDRLCDVEGKPVTVTDDSRITLWHPIGRELAEVMAWREWVEQREVVQPFKQAHREVYLLTDAERTTGSYSNRFASHIIRQHQFHRLTEARGWAYLKRRMDNDEWMHQQPDRVLPGWGVRAEFWVEAVGGVEDLTTTAHYLYLSTDQVRFYKCVGEGERDPFPERPNGSQLGLAEVPELVFSELMRDVDLFVGVASVGSDPTWSDGGPEGRFREYWESFSFGELGESARERAGVLERLLPRLAIAERARIEGRFLHVRGELRGYKIHLGSGNILMEPGDEYLCIVPEQAKEEEVYLPFEGDRTLSVILSKALMLAEDRKIKDPTIRSQIE